VSLILPLMLAAATPAAPAAALPQGEDARFKACVEKIDNNPEEAIAFAGQWRLVGGNIGARQCLGMAYAAQQRWASAITALEQAAETAQTQGDARAAGLWVQAGNAALASGDAAKARACLDAALTLGSLQGPEEGEARLDRARALVLTGDTTRARADLDTALKLVPQDPLAWLLSATLARRSGDLVRAQNDIGEAAKRAADDPSIALEAGNIAALAGRDEAARTAWEAARKMAPDSPVGKAAARALEQFSADPVPAAAPKP
jgi:tetratricopeptide (TPR) repeat protein